jgi:hypothetical protein
MSDDEPTIWTRCVMKKFTPVLLVLLFIVAACGGGSQPPSVETSYSSEAPVTTTTEASTTTSTEESLPPETTTTSDSEWGRGDTITPDPTTEQPEELPIESAADLEAFPAPAENPGTYYGDGSINCAYLEYVTWQLKQIGGYCEAQGDSLSGSPVAAIGWYNLASRAAELEGQYWGILSQAVCY